LVKIGPVSWGAFGAGANLEVATLLEGFRKKSADFDSRMYQNSYFFLVFRKRLIKQVTDFSKSEYAGSSVLTSFGNYEICLIL
jgi:hypothetical protein